MPLMSISPNIQELESPSRKRNHEAFSEEGPDKELPQLKTTAADNTHKQAATTMLPAKQTTLTTGLAPPAKKRKKLTPAEKTAQEQEKAAKKAEAEAGKKAKEAEKEQKRKEKEEELERKAREKKEKEEELEQKRKEKGAKDQEREQKRKEKQEAAEEKERKKREKQEEEERKKRAQRKIEGFFPKKPTTPKKPQTVPQTVVVDVAVAVGARSPSPAQAQTDYQKLATPFFVKENVKLATHHLLDPETQATKTSILDDYLAGRRSPIQTKSFDPVKTLKLPTHLSRGKRHPSVRELLSEHDGLRSDPIDLTTESQNLRIKKKQHSLKRIPVKHLKFHEDVRPAYYGTVTSVESVATLQKLAKNPIAKDLPLSYDYDSEAEWVDDDGDGDDVSLMDEDDVDEDDGEVLDDFLDDSEDVGRGPRFVTGALEPESSGLCFEDYNRRNPNPQMYKFRMEFMIPNLEHHHSVDPFSTEYWAPEPRAVAPKAAAPKAPAVASKTQGSGVKTASVTMPPPPIPASPFSMLGAGSAAVAPQTSVPQDLIKAERMDEFKAIVVEFNFLAKAALISTLKKKLGNCSLPEIKATLDYVAEKPSKKGDWQIKKGV
ncbi:Chromatin assembly factor 1 subunit rlf2 [Cytospora mali]|uniref:Chromatin assembly factor 1 subunit rlf2 n=1 Tax=Cytospora mali TaxID=578113 RepID=A0A194W478_CYTMA|nr:Chromatin assembly factor 1 subunit rlf2 [Valsa mali]